MILWVNFFIQLAFEMEEQFSFFIASVAIKKPIKNPAKDDHKKFTDEAGFCEKVEVHGNASPH